MKNTILNCYTNLSYVYEHSPITILKNCKPLWWKNLKSIDTEKTFFPQTNMKSCFGLNEIYTKAFSIPLWSDLDILVSSEGYEYQFADRRSSITTHDYSQWEGFVNPNKYIHLKINVPWVVECDKPIKFMMIPAVWEGVGFDNLDGFTVLSGFLDFKYSTATNIQCMIKLPDEGSKLYKLKHNQILFYIIPISDNKVKINNFLVSDEDYRNRVDKRFSGNLFFNQAYYKFKKLKCPFS